MIFTTNAVGLTPGPLSGTPPWVTDGITEWAATGTTIDSPPLDEAANHATATWNMNADWEIVTRQQRVNVDDGGGFFFVGASNVSSQTAFLRLNWNPGDLALNTVTVTIRSTNIFGGSTFPGVPFTANAPHTVTLRQTGGTVTAIIDGNTIGSDPTIPSTAGAAVQLQGESDGSDLSSLTLIQLDGSP
jgi:hypothetical protein